MKAYNRKNKPKHSHPKRYHIMNFGIIITNNHQDGFVTFMTENVAVVTDKTFKDLKNNSRGFLKFKSVERMS
jgi:hypothetical protein